MNNKLLQKLQNLNYNIKRKRTLKLYIRQKELANLNDKRKVLFKKIAYLTTDTKYYLLFFVFILALQPIINSNIQFAQASPNPALSISGYIWENEDGSGADTVSQISSGDGTIEAPWGSRINLRAQLKNTGDALSGANLGLFYDKGDNHWSKVSSSSKNNSYDKLQQLTAIDTSGDKGQGLEAAMDINGNIWTSYHADGDNLKVAKYVGTGGSGCNSSEWTCEIVDDHATNIYGKTSSIAINPSNNQAWVAYYDSTNQDLKVAKYVGTGGSGCSSISWDCMVIDTAGNVGEYSDIKFDARGVAYVTYRELITVDVSGKIKIAEFVGTGGSGCNSSEWTCSNLDDNAGPNVSYNTIEFDQNNKAWITYIDRANGNLMVAEKVGTGGTGCDIGSVWSCYSVSTTTVNGDPFLKIDKSGNPWISYLNETDLSIAKYVGSSGSCSDSRWECTNVDTNGNVGSLSSIDFDSNNNPWVSYRDSTNDDVKVARYVGSGGFNCAVTTWSCISIDSDYEISEGGFYSKLLIDSYDNVNILYYTAGTEDNLVIARIKNWKTGGGCDNNTFATSWDCYAIDNSGSVGLYSSIAVDRSGTPWIAYYDQNFNDVKIAKYVGIGGNCNSTKWQCTILHSTNDIGAYIDLAIGSDDRPWIATKDLTGNNLVLLTTNRGAGNDCTNLNWDCYTIDSTGDVGSNPSIVLDSSNRPWVSYWDATNTSLKIARNVVSGGTGCAIATTWTCITIDNTSTDYGFNSSIAINPGDDNPWVVYNGLATDKNLKIAKYDGAGNGACGADWVCTTIKSGNVGGSVSLAFDSPGKAWVAYADVTNNDLYVAKEVGASGTGCTSSAWTCSLVDSYGEVGQSANLAFDANGKAWVVYEQKNTGQSDRLKIAHYTSDNGTGCQGSNGTWNCEYLDGQTSNKIGLSAGIAFNPDGDIYVTYYDETGADLKFASLQRQGDIVLGTAQRYLDDSVISESHADMTSVTDTVNRDDADCIGGGTWNNGLYSSSAGLNLLSLPAGNVTPQCTEIVFSIDLTQADIGAKYRFMIATDDTWQSDKNPWRGLSGNVKTPELNVSDISSIFSKEKIAHTSSLCANSTTWYCEEFGALTDTDMDSLSFAMSPDGVPWVSYFDDTGVANSGDVYVANYVGTGGSGCGVGVTNWTCQKIFDTTTINNDFGIDMDFDTNGKLWIVFYHTNGNLYGVHFVGSGGTGCTSTAWKCEAIDTTQGTPGNYPSIAIDKNNNPWISSYDNTNNRLVISHYVGSGGNCTNSAWYCETVDSRDELGRESSIAISPVGVPWVVAMSAPNNPTVNETHYVIAMNYVGSGGTGCTSTAWQCYILTTRTDTPTFWSSFKPSIAFDHNGVPHAAFRNKNDPSIDTILAKFIGGTSQTSCGVGNTTAWDCTTITNTNQETESLTSLIFDQQNNPMIALATKKTGFNTADVGLTRYVGSGGTGCSGTTAYSCELIDQDTTNNFGGSLTFRQDTAGYGWIISLNTTTDKIRVARSVNPLSRPSLSKSSDSTSVMAYNTMGRYNNTLGKSLSSGTGQCNGTSDYFGACAYFHASGDYDSVVTQANETPVFLGAQKYDSNTILPTLQWEGNTNLAPNTSGSAGDILLQIYRYGTTNSWETIASNTTSASCDTVNCRLESTPSGIPSEYFELKNGKYWQYIRVIQIPSTTSITFKTDQLKATTNETRLRGGSYLQDGVRRPLNWR
jgi:hypothetical protein